MTKIEELRAAFEAATGGEWRYNGSDAICVGAETLFGGSFCDYYEPGNDEYALIALMHNALPALIECAEALDLVLAGEPLDLIAARAALEKLK